MDLIQSAFNSPMSQDSNARFRDLFGLFFTSLDNFEVVRLAIYHRYSDIDFSLIHLSFRENEENDFLLR